MFLAPNVKRLEASVWIGGVPFVSGTLVYDGKPPVVAYNGELYEDACVYALIKNTTGKIRVYKENIYEKTSAQSHFATKVDVSRKALIELDGRPAADVYSAEPKKPNRQKELSRKRAKKLNSPFRRRKLSPRLRSRRNFCSIFSPPHSIF